MTLEGATLPVPSEIVLPVTGFLVYNHTLDFWPAVAVASLGGLLGTVIDFSIGYYLGRPTVLRYGRKIRLNERYLVIVEGWFAKHGSAAVLFARFVPLLRTLIAFPAGVAKMRVSKFLATRPCHSLATQRWRESYSLWCSSQEENERKRIRIRTQLTDSAMARPKQQGIDYLVAASQGNNAPKRWNRSVASNYETQRRFSADRPN